MATATALAEPAAMAGSALLPAGVTRLLAPRRDAAEAGACATSGWGHAQRPALAATSLPLRAQASTSVRRIALQACGLSVAGLCDVLRGLSRAGVAVDVSCNAALFPAAREEDMMHLVASLRLAPPLRRLRFARCGLGDRQLAQLGRALGERVSELDVSSNSLVGASGFAGLAAAGETSHIVSLDVAGNVLSPAGAEAVAEAAEALGLLELVIGGAAGVHYMSASTVATCLEHTQSGFERLAVHSAVLDARASTAVSGALRPGAVLRLHDCTVAQAVAPLPCMRELALSRSGAPVAMTALARQCLDAGGLERLSVRRGGVRWDAIPWNEMDCSQLRSLVIERGPLWDSPAGVQAAASRSPVRAHQACGWQDTALRMLADRALPGLAGVGLHGGHWTQPPTTVEEVQSGSATACLIGMPTELDTIRLWDARLNEQRLGDVLRGLESRCSRTQCAPVRRLCLGGNDSIGAGGWRQLASWLRSGDAVRWLEELEVNACGLDDEAGALLLLALVQRPDVRRAPANIRTSSELQLRRLDMGSNAFGDATLTAASLLLIERASGLQVARLQHLRLHAPTTATRSGVSALLTGLLSSTSCRSCQAWTAALSHALPGYVEAFSCALRSGARIREARRQFALWALAGKPRRERGSGNA